MQGPAVAREPLAVDKYVKSREARVRVTPLDPAEPDGADEILILAEEHEGVAALYLFLQSRSLRHNR
jgi:hypothetical protein